MRNIREFQASLLSELSRKNLISPEQRAALIKELSVKKVSLIEYIAENNLLPKTFIPQFMAEKCKARVLGEGEEIKPTLNTLTAELYGEYKVIVHIVDERKATVYFYAPVFFSGWEDIAMRLERSIDKVAIDFGTYMSFRQEIEDGIKMQKLFALSTTKELNELEENKRAIQFSNEVIEKCIKLNASDIHIEPQKTNFRIRMRLNGVLHVFGEYDLAFFPAFSSRVKLISNMNIAEKRDTQDGAMLYAYKDENDESEEVKDIPFRASVMPTVYGEKIVLRRLGDMGVSATLENLGMSKEMLKSWKKVITKPHGIILVSGPTGSGKSTTLQAAINEIKTDEINITTVEDPVEAKIEGVNQVEINTFKVSFADALRSILRQDPDVIMIGEIRDRETAEIALRASLTGHLVYSTIHTNDAPSSVTRLVDMGIEPFLVSSSVVAVLAQRLARVLCDTCKQEDTTTRAEMSLLKLNASRKIYRSKGCFRCHNTGYTGRIGIYELMIVDTYIQRLINDKKSDVEIREYAVDTLHMPTLFNEAKEKFLDGVISIEEFQKIVVE